MTDPTLESGARASSDTALELLKQLIGLASGVLALGATFLEKFWTSSVALQVTLAAAWLLLMLSVVAGLQAISSLVQVLRKPDFTWSADAVRKWAKTSKWAFVTGLLLFAVFAFSAALTSTRSAYEPATPSIIISN